MAMTETLSATLPTATERLVDAVLGLADEHDLSLATAESCTGGLLASILTDVEGRSHVFERGFVVYTDAAKAQALNVDPDLLATAGAVSEPVARAMAEGALNRSGAGLAAAVTGFAGPAGPDDETGLVHFAVARRDEATTHAVRRFGEIGRGACRLACLEVALTMMKAALEAQQSPSVNRD